MSQFGRRPAIGTLLFLAAAGAFSCASPTRPKEQSKFVPCICTSNVILEFIGFYSAQDLVRCQQLLTPDFRFYFSSASDPVLAQLYPDGWGKSAEGIAMEHLFHGGTNQDGVSLEGAREISLDMLPTAPADDNSAGRDPNLYKTLLASIDLRVEISNDLAYSAGQAPPQNHRFFLVRGDAADSLDTDQPADSLHWYIYEWRDESPPLRQLTEQPTSVQSTTWGRLKGLYR